MRRVILWFVLVVISGGVLLGGLELLLQAGAWWVRATGRGTPVAWMTDEVRVLCLGDSNTYGLYLDPVDSWPSQLELRWNEAVQSPKVKVYNLGFPGTNSSNVRSDFVRMVDTFQPHVIVMMVGANDFWTVPKKLAAPTDSARSVSEFVESHSRLLRLAYMLYRANSDDELQSPRNQATPSEQAAGVVRREFEFGDEVFEVGMVRDREWRPGVESMQILQQNLEELVRLARAKSTPLLLMSYPAQRGFYPAASHLLERVAEESQTPFIDLRSEFATRCPDRECRELLFPDQHPKAAGYKIIASEVLPRISQLLAE